MNSKVANILDTLNIDAYLIYDFRGSNYIGRQVLNLTLHTTRRWVAIINKKGETKLIIPKIEEGLFRDITFTKLFYKSYEDFATIISKELDLYTNVAIDYSEENSIPVQDIVPAGFVEFLKKLKPNLKLVNSSEIATRVSALWGAAGYKSHKDATNDLTEIKDIVFEYVAKSLKDKKRITDFDASQVVMNEYAKRNLKTDDNLCIVSTNERTGNPHYWSTQDKNFVIEENSVLLVDIWAKKNVPNSIYSDSTFMAWIGPDKVPTKVLEVWDVVKTARDIGIEFVLKNINNDLRGYQVDRVVRNYINEKGYGDYFVHRTGHSIDQNDHGNGPDMDDFEKKDIRKVLPDTGFSIEPGVYLPEFGIRAEIDMYIHPDNTPEVSTFKQDELTLINT